MRVDLIHYSFSVLRKNKKLILFPILSQPRNTSSAVLATFAGLVLPDLSPNSPSWGGDVRTALSLVLSHLTSSAIFFNCALAACAQECFAGGDPTVSFGIQRAVSHLRSILAWAVITSTVGIALRAVQDRVPLAGKIAVWIFGAAWGMASYLVVPILIIENKDAIGSLKRSTQLLRDTWGPQLTAGIRFGWRYLLFAVPGVILGAIGANYYPPVLVLAAAYIVVLVAVMSAATGLFEVALYRYAASDEVPAGWPREGFSGAFRRS